MEDLEFNVQMDKDGDKPKEYQPPNIKAKKGQKQQQQAKQQQQQPQQQQVQQQESPNQEKVPHQTGSYDITKASKPFVVLFTILFKAASVLIYFFGTLIFDKIIIFISVVLCLSADFWMVKNISGRLLVGLRWWSDFKEDGTEEWRFESYNYERYINPIDKSFFWTSQVILSAFWAVFVAKQILTFGLYWLTLDILGFALSFANLWGFFKCSREHQKKMKDMKGYLVKRGLVTMLNNVMK